jgi:flagellar hook-basal body complex protein FliE
MDALSAVRPQLIQPFQAALRDPLAEARALRAPAPGEIGTLIPGQAVVPGDKVDVPRSFESVLGQLVEEVNNKQLDARDAVHGLLSGENIPLHRVVLASEEASVAFQLMVEVRNKLLEAYQELMRMQV